MRCCILVAGMPASGKTTFAEYVSRELGLPMISKDKIKEILYDTVGFANRDEKAAIGKAGTNMLYYYAASLMATGRPFILENNFENQNKEPLLALLNRYGYHSLTVRFGGDIDVIYQRYLLREQQQSRHKGHKGMAAYPQKDNGLLLVPLTLEEFVEGISRRGISGFSLGQQEIFVDTSNFEQVNFEAVVARIRNMLYGLQE